MAQTEVRVVNEHGKDVKHNGAEVGEIIVKGQGVVDQNSSLPDSVDNWVRTGDMGTIDEKGNIHVVESKKDITSSETPFSSIEIENVLHAHTAVQETVIIPVPDETLGEVVQAFVVLHKDQSATEQELIDFCLKRIDPAKAPKEITFMEELPKTASGKILKAQLRVNS
ncbi:class I adenylate-forming enzyme family protein [Virgibacillus oceani]